MMTDTIGQNKKSLRELLTEVWGLNGTLRKAIIAKDNVLADQIRLAVGEAYIFEYGHSDRFNAQMTDRVLTILMGKAHRPNSVDNCATCAPKFKLRIKNAVSKLKPSLGEDKLDVRQEVDSNDPVKPVVSPQNPSEGRANGMVVYLVWHEEGKAGIKVGLNMGIASDSTTRVKVLDIAPFSVSEWPTEFVFTALLKATIVANGLVGVEKEESEQLETKQQKLDSRKEENESKQSLPTINLKRGMVLDNGETQVKVWSFKDGPVVCKTEDNDTIEIPHAEIGINWVPAQ